MNTFMYHLSIDKETDIIVKLQVQKSHTTFFRWTAQTILL